MDQFKAEKKFFGFHPISFIDDVLNSMDEYCAESVEEMEKFLKSQKEYQTPKIQEQIHIGCEKVLKDLNEGVDKNMDKFELYLLRNIFKIPSGIKTDDINNESIEELLEEQRIEEMRLDKEISKAKERILQLHSNNALLRAQSEQLNTDIYNLEQFSNKLDIINQVTEEHKIESMKDTLKDLMDSSTELRDLVKEAKAKSAELSEETETESVNPASLGYDRSKLRLEDMKKFNKA